MAVPTAKTTSAQASEAATMPAAEADAVPPSKTAAAPPAKVAAVPGAETATVPAAEAPSVPCGAPLGVRCTPAASRSGKSRPGMAEMGDRRTRSDRRERTAHVTAMPPFGSDRREGEEGRTDKKREGGWAEDDEGRCHRHDDFGRRQDHDWGWNGGAK